jgi:hypothetical protein
VVGLQDVQRVDACECTTASRVDSTKSRIQSAVTAQL